MSNIFLSSGGGSMASGLCLLGLSSQEGNLEVKRGYDWQWFATWRGDLLSVGESRATSHNLGSWKPRTTSLAFAFLWGLLLSSSCRFFHVRIQRLFKICSGFSWRRRIGFRALVWIQQLSSAFFAFQTAVFHPMWDLWHKPQPQPSFFSLRLLPTPFLLAFLRRPICEHQSPSGQWTMQNTVVHDIPWEIWRTGNPSLASKILCSWLPGCNIVQSNRSSSLLVIKQHCRMGSGAGGASVCSGASRSIASVGGSSTAFETPSSGTSGSFGSLGGSGNISLSGWSDELGVMNGLWIMGMWPPGARLGSSKEV